MASDTDPMTATEVYERLRAQRERTVDGGWIVVTVVDGRLTWGPWRPPPSLPTLDALEVYLYG